jgi:hypothetical protein
MTILQIIKEIAKTTTNYHFTCTRIYKEKHIRINKDKKMQHLFTVGGSAKF